MPRYYFDLHDDVRARDQEGRDLPDDAAAREVGLGDAVEMVAASATEHRQIDLRHWIRVRRKNGETLARITFEEAVRFVRKGEAA